MMSMNFYDPRMYLYVLAEHCRITSRQQGIEVFISMYMYALDV